MSAFAANRPSSAAKKLIELTEESSAQRAREPDRNFFVKYALENDDDL